MWTSNAEWQHTCSAVDKNCCTISLCLSLGIWQNTGAVVDGWDLVHVPTYPGKGKRLSLGPKGPKFLSGHTVWWSKSGGRLWLTQEIWAHQNFYTILIWIICIYVACRYLNNKCSSLHVKLELYSIMCNIIHVALLKCCIFQDYLALRQEPKLYTPARLYVYMTHCVEKLCY